MNLRFVMNLVGNILAHACEAEMQCHCVIKIFKCMVLFPEAQSCSKSDCKTW
jgi:hypothetical protein